MKRFGERRNPQMFQTREPLVPEPVRQSLTRPLRHLFPEDYQSSATVGAVLEPLCASF